MPSKFKSTPNVLTTPECTAILNNYKNACNSAANTMNVVSVSLKDLFDKMLTSVTTLGKSPSIENIRLLIEGRDHLYNCHRGRKVYIDKCVPSGNRTKDQRKKDRGHENARKKFKDLWTIYSDDVKIMMSMISDDDLISHAQDIIDIKQQLSSQMLQDVTQFLTGITGEVTVIGEDKLKWSLYSKYTPNIEEYHKLLSICKFDQTMVLVVISVIHFFKYNDLELDYSRIFELIDRVSQSDLLLSFLTLRSNYFFLREFIIQVGNESKLSIPDMIKNLEDILEDPSLVSTLLTNNKDVVLERITMSLTCLSLVIRMDEIGFKLHKFHLSSIVKSGKDIDPEWPKLKKMKELTMISDIVKSLSKKFVKSKGDHMFELLHQNKKIIKLIRGDYKISDEGDVTIKTMGVVDLTGINFVYLPLDTLHMKRISILGTSSNHRVIGMNKIHRINKDKSLEPLKIPVLHFPEYTMTKIGDVNFVSMSE